MTENFRIAKKDLPENSSRWVICRSCNKKTMHSILALIEASDHEEEEHCLIWAEEYGYQIVQCRGCQTVSFAEDVIDPIARDDYQSQDHFVSKDHFSTTQLFPVRLEGMATLKGIHLLPHSIQKIYRETFTALCNDLLLLGAAGIRAIIDAVCIDQKAEGKNLFQKIENLIVKGVVTPDGAKTLHRLRFLGNKAIHEVKSHTKNELVAAFNVVEYLLQGSYIIPNMAAVYAPFPAGNGS